MMYLYWFIACAVLILFELLTTSLVFACIAFGAAVAGVAGMMGGDYLVSGLSFAVVSVFAVFFFRPILAKRFNTRNSQGTTNVLSLVGSSALVVEAVSASRGLVKVKGEVWSARAEGPEIEAGQKVTIADIDGATLIVSKATAK